MGSVGNGNAPQMVARQDISKLSKEQSRVMEDAYRQIEWARRLDLHDWAMREKFNVINPEESIIVQRYDNYGYPSEQYAINRLRQDAKEYAERFKDYYEERKQGIALMRASSSTLRALEKKGFIEIIEDGGRWIDRVKIIERS